MGRRADSQSDLKALRSELERLRERERHGQQVEERLRNERETLAIVNRIGLALTAELSLDRLVHTVTDAATELCGAEIGAFFYNAQHGHGYALSTLSGVHPEALTGLDMPGRTSLFAPTFDAEAIIRCDDVTLDPRYGKQPPHFGMPRGHPPVRSYLAVPVVSRSGSVLGAMLFGHHAVGVFPHRLEDVMAGIAAQVAVALDNADLYEEARLQKERAEREEARYRALAEDLEQRVAERTQELAQANERLREVDRLKTEFLATVSHELRTPLNSIIGFTEVILDEMSGPVTAEQRAQLGLVDNAAHHLLQLINTILDLTRIEAGRMALDITRFSLRDVVTGIVESMRPLAERKGLALTALESDDPLEVDSDAHKVAQILLNFVGNAVKFTLHGKVVVGCDRDEEHVCVWVRDTGIGIAPSHHETLFQPFSQVDGAYNRAYEGTGLGLYLCRRLAEVLDGEIGLESHEGSGSTFWLRLPKIGTEPL